MEYKTQKPNISSIELTRDLQPITIEDLVPQLRDKEYHFTVVPKDIMHLNNGIRHYYVEIQCEDGNFVVNVMAVKLKGYLKQSILFLNNNPQKRTKYACQ